MNIRCVQIALALFAVVYLLSGCGRVPGIGDGRPDAGPDNISEQSRAQLIPADDCSEVWALTQERYVNEMLQRLESNQEWIIGRLDGDCGGDGDSDADSDGDTDSDGDSDGDDDEADDASDTNNQVEGVYEADFVKNDKSHIYILADERFQIIDAWPPDQAHPIASVPIEGMPKKMFVVKDRAFIYSSLAPVQSDDPAFNEQLYSNGEYTYGYDCDFVGDGRRLKITVLDITDRTQPRLIRETYFSGSYLNARRIDETVYTVSVFPRLSVNFPFLHYWPEELADHIWACGDGIPFTEEEIEEAFADLAAKNTLLIQQTDFGDFIPKIEDIRYTDSGSQIDDSLLDECPNFYVSPEGDGMNLISLLATDIDDQSGYTSATILGKPGAVYASRESLYLASRHYQHQVDPDHWYFDEAVRDATTVHKFGFELAGAVSYRGSGVVKGRILNQFSMDEQGDFMRIATTTGRLPDAQVHNTLSILGPSEEGLAVTGMIDDIAPTEDIRAVRFDGDVGFIVTFKKTDPLFVLDLSNPEAPAITGELKIPGFSTYIHLMDNKHLLTIGYDANDQGDWAWFTGIQLQIVDISDPTDPRLIHKEVIGTRGSSLDAATDHLAFNYYATRDLLAFPMVICEGENPDDIWDVLMTFSGLLVYDVTAENGFNRLGGISHVEGETNDDNWGECEHWWTDPNTKVKRSVFMEDYVYSIAKDLINVAKANDLANPVAQIPLID